MKRNRKRIVWGVLGAAAVVGTLFGWFVVAERLASHDEDDGAPRTEAALPDAELMKRGEYLSRAADCVGCHTMRVGGKAYAGGFTLSTPFGLIVSTNITPDPVHGIGRYSYDDFARALRRGIARDGHNLYPAMPYVSFVKMHDDDIRALYEYMMHGVQPVAAEPPRTKVAFPFNQRWLLGLWRAIYAPDGEFEFINGKDAVWNRGAYLVQAAAHCGACHTPRGMGYQELAYDESSPHFLMGEVNDDWYSPPLRNSMGSGIGRLTEGDLVSFMKTGHAAGTIAYGSMVETIQSGLQYLTEADLRAIAVYLKTLEPGDDPSHYRPERKGQAEPGADQGNRTLRVQSGGAAVYMGFCARCHGADGAGVPAAFPSLSGNPSVLTQDSTSLVRIVLQGGAGPRTLTGPAPQEMPAFGTVLNDQQVAQVLTYVRQSWGNDAASVPTNDVASLRERLRME
jgi:mono/diheme cytochrome c family protein